MVVDPVVVKSILTSQNQSTTSSTAQPHSLPNQVPFTNIPPNNSAAHGRSSVPRALPGHGSSGVLLSQDEANKQKDKGSGGATSTKGSGARTLWSHSPEPQKGPSHRSNSSDAATR